MPAIEGLRALPPNGIARRFPEVFAPNVTHITQRLGRSKYGWCARSLGSSAAPTCPPVLPPRGRGRLLRPRSTAVPPADGPRQMLAPHRPVQKLRKFGRCQLMEKADQQATTARPVLTDTVEKVPKCLLAIFPKETKPSYAHQLIRHPGRCRSLL